MLPPLAGQGFEVLVSGSQPFKSCLSPLQGLDYSAKIRIATDPPLQLDERIDRLIASMLDPVCE
jgi:hypothetical protein